MKLEEELKTARDNYYLQVADVLRANPHKSYDAITAEYGFTAWAIKMAVKVGKVARPCGRKSPAYNVKTKLSN
jgi:hypothetical protein